MTETDAHHVMRHERPSELRAYGVDSLAWAPAMARPRSRAAGGYERLWLVDRTLFGGAVALVLAPRVLVIIRPRGGRLVEAR